MRSSRHGYNQSGQFILYKDGKRIVKAWDTGEVLFEDRLDSRGAFVEKKASKGKSEGGMVLNEGFLSSHFINDRERMSVVFEDAWIYVTDKKLSSGGDVLPILEIFHDQKETPFVIVAPEISGEALSLLILYRLNYGMNLCAVKAPFSGKRCDDILMDLAIMTGATLVSPRLGYTTQETHEILFGRARKVVIERYRSTIMGGSGDARLIEVRSDEIRRKLESSSSSSEREELQGRLRALSASLMTVEAAEEKAKDASWGSLLALKDSLMAMAEETGLFVSEKLQDGKDPPDTGL